MKRSLPSPAPARAGRGRPSANGAPPAVGLPPVTFDYLEKSLKKRCKRYRRNVKRCQDEFSEKSIHDIRVETRRLLSIVGLLGGFIPAPRAKKIESELKARLDVFDELRDTQVQLPIVHKMLRNFPAARPFHAYLAKREARLSAKTHKRLKAAGTGRLDKLITVCRKDVEQARRKKPAGKAGARVLRSVDRAFERAKWLRQRIDPRRPKTIHLTRVAFKKFRYMVEALAGCLPAASDKVLEDMHQYQTMMGRVQDAVVLLETLDKFLRKKKWDLAPSLRLREELLRRREWLIHAYLEIASQLRGFWPLSAPAAPALRRVAFKGKQNTL